VRGLSLGCLLRLLDVQRHDVDQVRLVSQPGQPAGIDARPPADVKDHGGRGRKVALDQFLGAKQFQRADAPGQTALFPALVVVIEYLAGEWVL
jgi:hypothetical protein